MLAWEAGALPRRLKASVARGPIFEVRGVRFTHSPYWHTSITSGPRHQWLGPFWGKVWCMSVTSLVLSHQVDRHAPQHGVMGYRSPKCPPGHSVEFPRRGTSRVTHVNMVPREGTRRRVPSPCLRPACLHLLRKLSWWRIQQVPFYTFGYPPMTSRATWTNRIGVVLHVLPEARLTRDAFYH